MPHYDVYTQDGAPESSRPFLAALQQQIGLIPNLAASMAESPQLLEGFVRLREVQAQGTFTPAEVQVLSLTNAHVNGCTYCMALHSTLALKAGVSTEAVADLRAGRSPLEPRLRALSDLSRKLLVERGRATQEDLEAFVQAGFTKAQALEVILGIGVSILPNFAHHLTGCPIDPIFEPQVWHHPER